MKTTMENHKRIDDSFKNLAMKIVYLVKDLLDLLININIQTNSNEQYKVSENGNEEEKEKVIVKKEIWKEEKGTVLEKYSTEEAHA